MFPISVYSLLFVRCECVGFDWTQVEYQQIELIIELLSCSYTVYFSFLTVCVAHVSCVCFMHCCLLDDVQEATEVRQMFRCSASH